MTHTAVASTPTLNWSNVPSSENIVRPSSDQTLAIIREGQKEMNFSKQDGSKFTAEELQNLNNALATVKENGLSSKLKALAGAGVKGLQITYVSLGGDNIGYVRENKILGVPLADDVIIKNAVLEVGQKIEFSGRNITCENVEFKSCAALEIKDDVKAGTLRFKGCLFPEGLSENDSQQVAAKKRAGAFRISGKLGAERLVLENTRTDRSNMIDLRMITFKDENNQRNQIEFIETSERGITNLSPQAVLSLYKGFLFRDLYAKKVTDAYKQEKIQQAEEARDIYAKKIEDIQEKCKPVYQRNVELMQRSAAIVEELNQLDEKKGAIRKFLVNHKRKGLLKEFNAVGDELNSIDKELSKYSVDALKYENERRKLVAMLNGEASYKKCRSTTFSVEDGIVFKDEAYPKEEKAGAIQEKMYLSSEAVLAQCESDLRYIHGINKNFAKGLAEEWKGKIYRFIDRLGKDGNNEYGGCSQLTLLSGVYDDKLSRAMVHFYAQMKKQELEKLIRRAAQAGASKKREPVLA